MRRRDFVKAMVAASVGGSTLLAQQPPPPVTATTPPPELPPGPMPWMRGLMEAKPLPIVPLAADAIGETSVGFFTAEQLAVLRRFSEILVPPYRGYPGAVEAGTPEFLDFLIGVSPEDRRQMYRSGLDRLDAEAKRRFGVSFTAVSAEQADELIRPWLRTWMSDHPPTEPYADFINVAHSDVRKATENSQAWSDAARAAGKQTPNLDLYWYPVDPDLSRGLGASTHSPSYGRMNEKGC